MSDPVTNVDVEDVLSSIRRLVSDTNSDDRQVTNVPETAEPAEGDAQQATKKAADALILTSALRVHSTEGDSLPEFRHTDMANFRHTISEGTPADEAPTSSDHADWPSMADDDYYEDDEQPESAPVIDFIRHGRKPEAKVVELDVEESASEKLDADGDDGANDNAEDTEQLDPPHDWVDEEADTSQQPEDDADDDGENVDHHEEPEFEDETAETPEVSEEQAQDAEEPSNDDEADEILAEEVVFASAAAASVMDEVDEQGDADVDLADLDESVIDEDALRDLVAEIVRQELTGDLGERITRNVRKLVRREIHRALLTREFE